VQPNSGANGHFPGLPRASSLLVLKQKNDVEVGESEFEKKSCNFRRKLGSDS
jgi:hypothetical protein